MTPETDDTDDTTEEGLAGGDVLETGIMVISVLLLVGLIGYTASQALVAPAAAEPNVSVESVERVPSDGSQAGDLRVTVRVINEGETGLSSVDVAVRCGSVERSLSFEHVPARGYQTGTAVCPGGTTPNASAVTWIEA